MKKNVVIPSRADGEGSLKCKLRYALTKEAVIAGARSLAPKAFGAQDDTRFLPPGTLPPQT